MSAIEQLTRRLDDVKERLGEVDVYAIAGEVHASRQRVLAVDPGAYSGFVMDAAILAVAKRTGEDWRVILGAWRRVHPRPKRGKFDLGPAPPLDARQPTDEAKAVA